MKYNEQQGNLFELDDRYNLAHCISKDCEMGAGIATEFNRRFPKMKSKLKQVVSDNKIHYPFTIFDIENKVFNLITKESYFHKPSYDSITIAIRQMAAICKREEIRYLGMPRIGSGLDRLQWCIVKDIIMREFEDVDIEIEVRYL